MDVKELELDLGELRSLLSLAKRPAVQDWMKLKIDEKEKELKKLLASQPQACEPSASPATNATNASKPSAPISLPTVKVTNY
ncbi:siah interacting protein, partial [Oesophagostomum dentatum]